MAAARMRIVGLAMSVIVIGTVVVVGMLNADRITQWLPTTEEAHGEPAPSAAAHAHGDESKHVALTSQARDNLGLETGRVVLSDYYRTLRVPGVIREKPGHSDHAVATTVHGIVKRIHAVPGETVKPGEPLFDLQLTGEALATAQSGMLDLLQQLETLGEELKRIEPLAQSGGVAGKRKLEIEYETKRLQGQRDAKTQELLVRGLHPDQVRQIVTEKRLIREFTVSVPDHFVDEEAASDSPPTSPADALARDETQFTMESLDVFPGKAVNPGDSLCHLAYHTVLYVEGQAFENEIDAIGKLQENQWTANLEFGTEGHEQVKRGVQIHYLDNHVDPDSQTFRFYVRLENEVLQETRDEKGKLFRAWRFRPGQRLHVIVPVQKYEKQLALPLVAVVQEGPDAFIFRRIARMREPGGTFTDEFEQVPVRVLHQDKNTAVIAADQQVRPGDIVALNNAYQLQLALTSSQGGGGGGHDHHGHSH